MTDMVSQTPVRSDSQRMEALERANTVRIQRAQLKKDLKSGQVSVFQILKDPPDYTSTMKVFKLLRAVPKFGPFKAEKVLHACRVSQAKTLGGLSERQRTAIADMLRSRGLKEPDINEALMGLAAGAQ